MKKEKYIQELQNNFDTCIQISIAKSADYAGDVDAFANFKQSATISGIPVEQTLLVRIADKISRLTNLIGDREPQVLDESVRDTILDCANYLNILAVYLEHERDEGTKRTDL